MTYKFRYILISSLFLLFSFILEAQKVENLEAENKELKAENEEFSFANEKLIKDIKNKDVEIKNLKNQIKGLVEAVNSALEGEGVGIDVDSYIEELEKVNSELKKLEKERANLNGNINSLNARIKERDRRIVDLEKKEKILRDSVIELESYVELLLRLNDELSDTLKKAEQNIDGLVSDTILLNSIIRAKDLQIYNLEQDTITYKDRIRFLENRVAILEDRIGDLIETNVKLKEKKEKAENDNIIDKLSLINTYGGINYSLYNGSHILPINRKLSSDFTLTFYNLFVGTGFFFQLPNSYKNHTGSLTTVRETPHYFNENLDVYVQELDITGNPAYSYTKPTYSETQGDFRIFNYGLNLSVARNFYLIAGLTNVRGATWDLYSGDLDAYGLLGNNAVAPQKYNNHYIVNFEELRVNKGMIGVASTFTIEKKIVLDEKRNKTNNRKREDGKNNFGGRVQEYDYMYGFQVEVGYNWLYEDVFVNVGLHVRLWDYKKKHIVQPNRKLGEGKNDGIVEMNKGYDIYKEAVSLNIKLHDLDSLLLDENNKTKIKIIRRDVKKIKEELADNTYKNSTESIIRGLNILIDQLERKADNKRIDLYLEIIEFKDRNKNKIVDNELEKELNDITGPILEKIKNYENFAFCLRETLSLEGGDTQDDKQRHEEIRRKCVECVKGNDAFREILKEEFSDNGKSIINKNILDIYFYDKKGLVEKKEPPINNNNNDNNTQDTNK